LGAANLQTLAPIATSFITLLELISLKVNGRKDYMPLALIGQADFANLQRDMNGNPSDARLAPQ